MSNLSLGEMFYEKEIYVKILNDKIQHKIHDLQISLDNTIKNIPKCIVQLFLEEDGRYDADATAVLIELNKSYYIFSESHAVKSNSRIFINNNFIEIPFEWSIQSNLEQNKSEDIYIAKLLNKLDFKDRIYYKINLNNLNYEENNIIGFSGFPYTKNGTKWGTKEFKNRPYLYFGISKLLKEVIYDNNRHLKIFNDREKMLNSIGGSINIGPSPKGMSGGGVFHLSNNIASFINGIYDIKLIGIGIEFRDKVDKSLIGHSLAHFLNVMVSFNKLNIKHKTINYKIDKNSYYLKEK